MKLNEYAVTKPWTLHFSSEYIFPTDLKHYWTTSRRLYSPSKVLMFMLKQLETCDEVLSTYTRYHPMTGVTRWVGPSKWSSIVPEGYSGVRKARASAATLRDTTPYWLYD